MKKPEADWYAKRDKEQIEARKQVEKNAIWRAERIAALQVQPIMFEGTFISRVSGNLLAVGFAEHKNGEATGVNLFSTRHGDVSQFVGRRCRVTVEVLP